MLHRFLTAIFITLTASLAAGHAAAQDAVPDRREVVTKDVDFFGSDLDPLFDTTLEACRNLCFSNNACRAYTFNTRSNSCFPKSALTETRPYEGAISAEVFNTDARVLNDAPARTADLDFLSPGDLNQARDQATGIGARHPGGQWDVPAMVNAAQDRIAQQDYLNAMRWMGAAVARSDAADQWAEYARLSLLIPDAEQFRETQLRRPRLPGRDQRLPPRAQRSGAHQLPSDHERVLGSTGTRTRYRAHPAPGRIDPAARRRHDRARCRHRQVRLSHHRSPRRQRQRPAAPLRRVLRTASRGGHRLHALRPPARSRPRGAARREPDLHRRRPAWRALPRHLPRRPARRQRRDTSARHRDHALRARPLPARQLSGPGVHPAQGRRHRPADRDRQPRRGRIAPAPRLRPKPFAHHAGRVFRPPSQSVPGTPVQRRDRRGGLDRHRRGAEHAQPQHDHPPAAGRGAGRPASGHLRPDRQHRRRRQLRQPRRHAMVRSDRPWPDHVQG